MVEKDKVRVVNTRTNAVKYVTPYVADSEWMRKQGWKRQELPEQHAINAAKATEYAEQNGGTVVEIPEVQREQAGGLTHIVEFPDATEKLTPIPEENRIPPAGMMGADMQDGPREDNLEHNAAWDSSRTENIKDGVMDEIKPVIPPQPIASPANNPAPARRAGRPPKNTTNQSNQKSS